MTPGEVAEQLYSLNILFQVEQKGGMGTGNPILDALTGGMRPPPTDDFSDSGYNAGDFKEDDEEPKNEKKKEWLYVVQSPEQIRKYSAWFLGKNPPSIFEKKLLGKIMSCAIKERNLTILMEDVPWGLYAGKIEINCEYITAIEYKNGSLFISSKVGNVAIQIHEVTKDQYT